MDFILYIYLGDKYRIFLPADVGVGKNKNVKTDRKWHNFYCKTVIFL